MQGYYYTGNRDLKSTKYFKNFYKFPVEGQLRNALLFENKKNRESILFLNKNKIWDDKSEVN